MGHCSSWLRARFLGGSVNEQALICTMRWSTRKAKPEMFLGPVACCIQGCTYKTHEVLYSNDEILGQLLWGLMCQEFRKKMFKQWS